MRYVIGLVLFALVLSGAAPKRYDAEPTSYAIAFELPQAIAADDTCTSDLRERREAEPEEGDGLVTQIIDYIKDIVDETSRQLFVGIASDSGFQKAVNASFALMIAFFGAAFMFGVVPLTFGQALTRLLKMAFIMALIGGGGWTFFSQYVVTFFNDGTDELISHVIGIATGDPSPSIGADGSPQPFRKLEEAAGKALSPEMMISAITAFTTGPMGPAMGGMLGIGLLSFVQMLIRAVRVYVISLVAKALLFGLAPIFITFILFERTKSMFTGWVNQLVNYSLQPLLLFTFLSFFVVLMESALDNILGTDICWTTTNHAEGVTTENMFWRFTDENGDPTGSPFTWEGLASCIEAGGGGKPCEDFPISVLDILTFLILGHLAYRFSDIVVHIATEISSSMLALDKLRSGFTEVLAKSQQATAGSKPS